MAYTPPAGNLVALHFTGAYTAPAGNVVPLPFADPDPPDPEPEVPVRWTGRAASLPWSQAARRSRQVRSTWSRATSLRQRARLPWSAAPEASRRVVLPWSRLATLAARARLPWGRAAQVLQPIVSIPWRAIPRLTASASLPWGMPGRVTHSAQIAWTAPPRIAENAALPWGLPPRLAVAAALPWRNPDARIARHWLPWSYAPRVRWRVRSPGVEPPDDDTPWTYQPPQGNHVALNFACPQLDHPGNQVPVPFGPAACYFAWPRPRRYIVLNSAAVVRLPERTPIPVSSVSLSSSVDDAMWTVGMTLADPAALAWLLPDEAGAKSVEINLNGHVWTAIIESHTRSRRFPATTVQVSGRSRTAVLDAPFAATRAGSNAEDAQAQSLADAEVDLTGISIDWDTLTWLVPAGAWHYDGLTPIAAVRKIAEADGAVLQSHPWDLELRVAPRYPVSPWFWGVTAPDAQILDDMILEDTLRVDSKPVFDYVLVSGEQVGVSDEVIRDGSAGETRAAMVVDALITEHEVAAERGRNVLCDRGEQAQIDLSIPLWPPSASDKPGLVLPLDLVEVVEAVAWKGQVTAVAIEARVQSGGSGAQALVIEQRITLERHYTDAG